ncbi:MAG TPA: serine hydroxymethyltransferase [Solirubrobacteraceae bacterium]|jgi:glycine hydroxymethyltransferase|nr:serine hydroxymethyltransferase [Solirubrobacteraceae bacterium]
MTELAPDYFIKPVSEVDPEIADLLAAEARRQETTLEMIASENFVPQAVMDCHGSTLTNKYAEGLPGKRYYGGCEHVDVVETLAIERAKALFGAEHANVQPNGGASANAAAMMAMIKPGDKILGMRLDHGGHLTHGMKLNFSGKLYEVVAYGVSDEDSRVDMDALQKIAEEERPQLIIGGWSAYPRQLDWARMREIADSVGALFMVDMAHFAGLVAAGQHPSPVPHADVVTTTIHKTLGGSRGGMILCTEEWAKKINTAVFPGQQGGPLMHVIAGKAVSLKVAATDTFKERQQRTRAGAAAVAHELLDVAVNVLTGGTDVHLVLADLRDSELSGQDAEDRLHDVGITVNRNAVPNDPRPAMVTSGLRIGTPALATRGLSVEDFHEIGQVIAAALTGGFGDVEKAELSERARALTEAHPLYPHLTPAAV